MSRGQSAAGLKRRPRTPAPPELPPWPTVPDEPITAPTQSRRAWGSISYEQRYREQREAFLRITRELANTSSPDAVQISHIVAAAGVSRRTFYEHFASKEACFAEIARTADRPFVEIFVRAAEAALPSGPLATFRAIISAWTGLVTGDPPMFSREFALRIWTDGLRPGSPYAEPLSHIIDLLTDVFVVAAQRLGSPLKEPLLHLAARQQVLGLVGTVLQPVDHRNAEVDDERLATVLVVGLGFPEEP